MNVGVLALQGSYARHWEKLSSLGAKPSLVRTETELQKVSALVIPGGESTTFLRLLKEDFRQALISRITEGLPCLATCAGVILLAKEVENPAQDSLALLDIKVSRNAYGRQLDSFIEPLEWTEEKLLQKLGKNSRPLEGVFIRAPKITACGEGVTTLANCKQDPVLVSSGNIIGATFHPELSPTGESLYRLFLRSTQEA